MLMFQSTLTPEVLPPPIRLRAHRTPHLPWHSAPPHVPLPSPGAYWAGPTCRAPVRGAGRALAGSQLRREDSGLGSPVSPKRQRGTEGTGQGCKSTLASPVPTSRMAVD